VVAFAAEQLVEDQAGVVPGTKLLRAVNAWCAQRGLKPTNKTRLGLAMGRLGFRKRRTGTRGNTVYVGIRLRELPC
jgi:hypothetical protein